MTDPATHHTWSAGQFVVDGVELHYERAGCRDRRPLVMAHGLSDSGRCWQRVTDAVGDSFDVVMLDARNHGRSATATATPDALADDVGAVISALALRHPILMGHSVGAHTMALLASREPDLASLLVLEDPPWTAERESVGLTESETSQRRRDIASWLASLPTMTDADMVELGRTQHPTWPAEDRPAWIESNQQVRVEAADSLDPGAWGPIVDAITCPTLLLHGEAEHGGLVTTEVAARVAARNPHITTDAIAGAGHNIRREQFEQYLDTVSGFLLTERKRASSHHEH